MPLSAKGAVSFAAIAAALLLIGTWMLRSEPVPAQKPASENLITGAPGDVSTARVSTSRRLVREPRRTPSTSSRTAEMTSGIQMIPALAPPQDILPPLTGYIVDSFENWTTIPAGYSVEGLALRNGTVILSDTTGTTGPRFGQMISPALPLLAPALAAPVNNPGPLAADANITLEISLTEDGTDWSPWVAVEKYTPPDGKRVTPPLQATISDSDLTRQKDSTSAAATSGPQVRYRLSLSATSSASPAIADIRIWKREVQ